MAFLTERETFARDLSHGQEFEQLAQQHLIEYLKKKLDRTFVLSRKSDNNEYDFRLIEPSTRKVIAVEVKGDKESRRTNSFYFEYNNGYDYDSYVYRYCDCAQ